MFNITNTNSVHAIYALTPLPPPPVVEPRPEIPAHLIPQLTRLRARYQERMGDVFSGAELRRLLFIKRLVDQGRLGVDDACAE